MNEEKSRIDVEFDATRTVNIKEWAEMTSGRNDVGTRVSVPVLQRGLVWSPIQNEMIWDSLLRGFPIGSFIVAQAIQTQVKKGVKASGSHYHLLDGQQRSHAISLGYQMWEECCDSKDGVIPSILWLDLDPDRDQLAKTMRKFAIRVTTPAHPWGYQLNDTCSRISSQDIRKAMSNAKQQETDEAKPAPAELKPAKAACPIPLYFLLSVHAGDDHQKYWDNVIEQLPKDTKNQWVEGVMKLLVWEDLREDQKNYLQEIKQGIALVQKGCVVVIPAPCGLERESIQESRSSQQEGISNIEQLFQRVNRGGTRLDGEELLYSMIKAYFPEISEAVDKASHGRMPASRLVALSVRCALSDEKSLHASVSVAEIRRIASDPDKKEEKARILQFILGEGQDDPSVLSVKCDNVTKLLEDGGLFPFLRTSIAVNSPVLYLFMMWFYAYGKVTEENEVVVRAFVCAVHWLADKKEAIVKKVFEALNDDASGDSVATAIREGMQRACEDSLLYVPHPRQFDEFLQERKSSLQERKRSSRLGQEERALPLIRTHILHENNRVWNGENGKRWNWDLFFWKVLDNREFVYFAQRKYMTKKFGKYDPAQKDMWQAINRPWDLDHLVPASYFYKQKDIIPALRDWYNRNGNMRAWALEENRADGDDPFCKKMNDKQAQADSFIDERVYGLFSKVKNKEALKQRDVAPDVAPDFILGVMLRMQSMYADWYDQLNIQLLSVDGYIKKPIE